jgi:hypothetical protein
MRFMTRHPKQNRREFLRISAAGAAAFSMGGIFAKNASAATGLAWPDTGALAINPAIDNLRVVVCNDPTMISGAATGTFQSYNTVIDTAKLQGNMDKMAMALAQINDAKAAWAAIFRKPQGKTWAQVNVAIKVNTVDTNDSPKLSIINKVCTVLNTIGTTTADPGVLFANMTIYDSNGNVSTYKSSFSAPKLPTGIKVVQNLGNAVNSYALPKGTATLTSGSLNNGSIDILVNIAMNKGHDQFDKGKTTLCLKNHYGSFSPQTTTYPRYKGNQCGNLDYLIDINKSNPIIGGTPPRQQLCIIDSLWAMESGPSGGKIVQNNRLVMGTFAGAVDYLVARKIRQETMKIPVGTVDSGVSTDTTMNNPAIDKFLTGFGYDLASPNVANLNFVDALAWIPAVGVSNGPKPVARRNSLQLTLSSGGLKSSSVNFALPGGPTDAQLLILDMKGRTVRKLPVNSSETNRLNIIWDGRSSTGQTVSAGNYLVQLSGKGINQSGMITVGE